MRTVYNISLSGQLTWLDCKVAGIGCPAFITADFSGHKKTGASNEAPVLFNPVHNPLRFFKITDEIILLLL